MCSLFADILYSDFYGSIVYFYSSLVVYRNASMKAYLYEQYDGIECGCTPEIFSADDQVM